MNDNPYYAPGMPEDDTLDHIVRATALDGHVKALAIRTTGAVREAARIHGTSSAATAALGRFITGSLLLADNMKNPDDSQTTILRCDGPLGGMTCVCDSSCHAKAYANNPDVPTSYIRPGKINVAEAVGKGTLTVIRDIGLREPYVGSVELVSGEIAEDFTYYLAASEQTPSVVALGVLMEGGEVKHAGGMMIQLMPGASEEDITYIEERVNGGFPEITFLLEEGFSPAKILDLFIGNRDLVYLSGRPAAFKCYCSREKMSAGLAALGKADLEELIASGEPVQTECHFCGAKYVFETDEIREMLKK